MKGKDPRIRNDIYRVFLFAKQPLKISEVYDQLSRSGRWPILTQGKVRRVTEQMANDGTLSVKMRGGVRTFEMRKETHNASVDA